VILAPGASRRCLGRRGLSASLLAGSNFLKIILTDMKEISMSETVQKSFDAIIQKEGKFTFVAIPFSPREAWGAKPRYPVGGTINGISVRGTLGAFRQDYFLRLGAAWMQDSGLKPGENVTVKLFINGPHESNVASDITKALSSKKKQK